MPIILDNTLLSYESLTKENISLLYKKDFKKNPTNTLKIAILNLMPNKIETELQILKLLDSPYFFVEVTFLYPETHKTKNTSIDYLCNVYSTFSHIKHLSYDGLIITGAPLEKVDFEDIDYWTELKDIMEFSKTKVKSTIHICWASIAGLYYHYDLPKKLVSKKIFGVYPCYVERKQNLLLKDLKKNLWIPHSRYFLTDSYCIENIERLQVLISSKEAGAHCIASLDYKQIFLTGHWEYQPKTLINEYKRDISKGLDPIFPKNYSSNLLPYYSWMEDSLLFFKNWLKVISKL